MPAWEPRDEHRPRAVAWTAGFPTPGAPGGLCVREAVLPALPGPVTGDAAALAWRLATLGGELVYFGSSFAGGGIDPSDGGGPSSVPRVAPARSRARLSE